MSGIFPKDVVWLISQQIGNVNDYLNLMSTCKVFYQTFLKRRFSFCQKLQSFADLHIVNIDTGPTLYHYKKSKNTIDFMLDSPNLKHGLHYKCFNYMYETEYIFKIYFLGKLVQMF